MWVKIKNNTNNTSLNILNCLFFRRLSFVQLNTDVPEYQVIMAICVLVAKKCNVLLY